MDQSHAPQASAPDASALRVTLELYSGRVNPSWALGAAAAAEFQRRIAALPVADKVPNSVEALGYRGLRVVTADAGGDAVSVGRGVVTVRRGTAAPRTFRDDARALERWLLDTGRAVLDPALYAHAAGQIGH